MRNFYSATSLKKSFALTALIILVALSGKLFAQTYTFVVPSSDSTSVYSGSNTIGCYSKPYNWICQNGYLHLDGGCGGANSPYPQEGIFLVEAGGTIDLRGAGGSFTAYLKAGATYIGGGGGSNIIYADPTATITNPGTTVIYGTINFNYSNAPANGCVPIITGPQNPCEGTNVVYTTSSGETNYMWSVTGGTINGGGGTTNNTVTVSWTSTSGTVSVYYTSGGVTSVTGTYSVTPGFCGAITATPTVTNASYSCGALSTNGAISVAATGGNAQDNYYFSISGPQSASGFGKSPYQFTGLAQGNYSISVVDATTVLDPAIDQNVIGTSVSNIEGPMAVGGTQGGYQSFEAGQTGKLMEIDLTVGDQPNTTVNATGTLYVYSGSGISGTLLTSQAVTISGTTPSNFYQFVSPVVLNTPVSVTSGQIYTFYLNLLGGNGFYQANDNGASGSAPSEAYLVYNGNGAYQYGGVWSYRTWVAPLPVADGYQGTATATVSYNSACGAITATPTATNASYSCGTLSANGAISVAASGGNGQDNYYYSISGPQSASGFGASPYQFTGLAQGSYSISVQDASAVTNKSIDVSQTQSTGYTEIYNYEQSYYGPFYQPFKAGKTGSLTDIVLGFSTGYYTTASFNANLTIYSGSGVSGTVLSTTTILVSSGSSSSSSYSFMDSVHLATAVPVTAGQTYTYLVTPTSDFYNYIFPLVTSTSSAGPGYYEEYGSYYNSGSNYDFETYVTTAGVPDGYTGTGTANVSYTTACGPITASSASTNATNNCSSHDGTITVTASGGDGSNNYYFSLTGPQTVNLFATSPHQFTGLTAGSYNISVQDAAAIGQTVTDQNQSTDVSYYNIYNSGSSYGSIWQSFTAGKSGKLAEVDLGLNTYEYSNYTANGTLYIYSGNGVSGSPLATQTVSVASNASSYTNYTVPVVFTTPATITSGQQYTFEFVPGSGFPQYYAIQYCSSSSFSGGQFEYDYGSFDATSYDMVFKTTVTIPAVPDGYLGTATQTISGTTACTDISVTATPANASNSCNENNGSITISATGGDGSGNYYFAVTNTNTNQTSSAYGTSPTTISGLYAGPYTVSVQDEAYVGTPTVDQAQTANTGSCCGYPFSPCHLGIYQSFTPAKTGLLTEVDLGLQSATYSYSCSGGSASFAGVLDIYAGGTLPPNSSPIYTQTITIHSTNANQYYFDPYVLTSSIPLTGGQQYTFYVASTTGQDFHTQLNNPSTYSGGTSAFDVGWNGGQPSGYTSIFQTYLGIPTNGSNTEAYIGTTTTTVSGTLNCGPIGATPTQANATNNCGSLDGSLTVTVNSGGDGRNDYYYNVSGPSGYTSYYYGASPKTFTGLQQGNYTVTVADAYSVGIPAQDQSQSVDDNAGAHYLNTSSGYGVAQTFTAGKTGNLSEIDMSFYGSYYGAYTGTGQFKVFSGSGNSGTLLATQTVTVTMPGSYSYVTNKITFSTPPSVTAGQIYTFQFLPTSGFPSYFFVEESYEYYTNYTNSGQMYTVSGGSYSATSYELVFATYVTTPAIPDNSKSIITETVNYSHACSNIVASAPTTPASYSCHSDGIITINASAGNWLNSYSYTVTGPQNRSGTAASPISVTGLPPGTYTVTVNDAITPTDGYSATVSNVVVGYTTACGPIIATATTSNSISSCYANGSITVSASRGNYNNYYYYVFSGPTNYSAYSTQVPYTTPSSLLPGNYNITVYDGSSPTNADGWEGTTTATISPTNTCIKIVTSATSTNSSTSCSDDGTVTVYASKGDFSGFYTFTISGPVTRTMNGPSGTTFTGVPSGNYTVTSYDATTYPSDPYSNTTTVTVNPNTSACGGPISATAAASNSTSGCSYDGSLTITINSGGDGLNKYDYYLSGPVSPYNTDQPSGYTFYGLPTGYYNITVFNHSSPDGYDGKSYTFSAYIYPTHPLTTPSISNPGSPCWENYFQVSDVSGNTYTSYSWSIDGPGELPYGNSNTNTETFGFSSTPGYSLNIYLTATDPYGCNSSTSETIYPNTDCAPTPTIFPDTGTQSLCDNYYTESNYSNYSWSVPYGGSLSTSSNNEATVCWYSGYSSGQIYVSYDYEADAAASCSGTWYPTCNGSLTYDYNYYDCYSSDYTAGTPSSDADCDGSDCGNCQMTDCQNSVFYQGSPGTDSYCENYGYSYYDCGSCNSSYCSVNYTQGSDAECSGSPCGGCSASSCSVSYSPGSDAECSGSPCGGCSSSSCSVSYTPGSDAECSGSPCGGCSSSSCSVSYTPGNDAECSGSPCGGCSSSACYVSYSPNSGASCSNDGSAGNGYYWDGQQYDDGTCEAGGGSFNAPVDAYCNGSDCGSCQYTDCQNEVWTPESDAYCNGSDCGSCQYTDCQNEVWTPESDAYCNGSDCGSCQYTDCQNDVWSPASDAYCNGSDCGSCQYTDCQNDVWTPESDSYCDGSDCGSCQMSDCQNGVFYAGTPGTDSYCENYGYSYYDCGSCNSSYCSVNYTAGSSGSDSYCNGTDCGNCQQSDCLGTFIGPGIDPNGCSYGYSGACTACVATPVSTTQNITLNTIPAIQATVTTGSSSCSGQNGTITISAVSGGDNYGNGGSGEYYYLLIDGGSTYSGYFYGSSGWASSSYGYYFYSGNHTVEIRDGDDTPDSHGNEYDNSSVSIGNSCPISYSNYTLNNASCPSNNDGSITVNSISGGDGSNNYAVAVYSNYQGWVYSPASSGSTSITFGNFYYYESLSGLYVYDYNEGTGDPNETSQTGSIGSVSYNNSTCPTPISFSYSTANATCPSSYDGSITVYNLSGGDGSNNYVAYVSTNYGVFYGNPNPSGGASSITISGLPTFYYIYDIYVYDNDNPGDGWATTDNLYTYPISYNYSSCPSYIGYSSYTLNNALCPSQTGSITVNDIYGGDGTSNYGAAVYSNYQGWIYSPSSSGSGSLTFGSFYSYESLSNLYIYDYAAGTSDPYETSQTGSIGSVGNSFGSCPSPVSYSGYTLNNATCPSTQDGSITINNISGGDGSSNYVAMIYSNYYGWITSPPSNGSNTITFGNFYYYESLYYLYVYDYNEGTSDPEQTSQTGYVGSVSYNYGTCPSAISYSNYTLNNATCPSDNDGSITINGISGGDGSSNYVAAVYSNYQGWIYSPASNGSTSITFGSFYSYESLSNLYIYDNAAGSSDPYETSQSGSIGSVGNNYSTCPTLVSYSYYNLNNALCPSQTGSITVNDISGGDGSSNYVAAVYSNYQGWVYSPASNGSTSITFGNFYYYESLSNLYVYDNSEGSSDPYATSQSGSLGSVSYTYSTCPTPVSYSSYTLNNALCPSQTGNLTVNGISGGDGSSDYVVAVYSNVQGWVYSSATNGNTSVTFGSFSSTESLSQLYVYDYNEGTSDPNETSQTGSIGSVGNTYATCPTLISYSDYTLNDALCPGSQTGSLTINGISGGDGTSNYAAAVYSSSQGWVYSPPSNGGNSVTISSFNSFESLSDLYVYDYTEGTNDQYGTSETGSIGSVNNTNATCPTLISYSGYFLNNALCPGSQTGSLTLYGIGGGDGSSNYVAAVYSSVQGWVYSQPSSGSSTITFGNFSSSESLFQLYVYDNAEGTSDPDETTQTGSIGSVGTTYAICPMAITFTVQSIQNASSTCPGVQDGSITISGISGGNGNSNYVALAWIGGFPYASSNGAGPLTIGNLQANTYDSVTVYDFNAGYNYYPSYGAYADGWQSSQYTITVGSVLPGCPIETDGYPSNPSPSTYTSPSSPCSTDGSVTIAAFYGDGTGYYLIDAYLNGSNNAYTTASFGTGNPATASVTLNNLPAGNYQFVIYDADNTSGSDGLSYSFTYQLQPQVSVCPITATVTTTAPTTCNGTDGTIAVTVSGGGNFSQDDYEVDYYAAGTFNPFQGLYGPSLGRIQNATLDNTGTFNNVPAGTYDIWVIDYYNGDYLDPTYGYYSSIFDGAASEFSGEVVAPGSCGPNTWLGGSTDWSDPTNWSNANPPSGLCSESVSIPTPGGTDQEPILRVNESVGNLSLGSGASITLDPGVDLMVCGNVTGGNGTSDGDILGNGILILNGSSLQQISGKVEVQTVQISNSAGVQVQSGAHLNIYNVLQLATGQLDATNGTVKLKSTSVTQAAIIDNFSMDTYNGTYKGNITAERFYGSPTASNDFSQHMLGSPVSGINLSALGSTNATSAYYQPFTSPIVGVPDPDNQCDELLGNPGTPYGNVFSYDETHASTCTMNGWLVDAASTPASAGTGYSVVLGSGSGTLAVTGPPNLNQSYTTPTTNSGYPNTTSDQGRVYSSGINLLSNPYPASLDISSLVADNPGFSGTVYVWNESTGSYYTPTSPAVIAPFQAFKVILGTPDVQSSANYVINATSRTIANGTFQRTTSPMELNMTVANNGTGLTDETTVGFNPASTAQFNPTYDLIKLPGALTRHTLYSLNSNDWMWVNTLKSISETSTVPVGFEPGVNGTYTASFGGLNSFDPTSYIMLEDKQTGTMFNVRNGTYAFSSNASDNFDRFVLHFTPPASITATDASCSEQGMIDIVQPGTAIWNYTLADNNNVTLSSGTLNVNSPVSASVSAGVYTLTLVDNNGYTVVKTIEVSGAQPVVASFTASANAVNVNQEVTLSSTASGAVINSWNFGDGTTDNGTTVSHTYTSEGVYSVVLNSTSASGCTSSASNTITVTRSVTGVTDLNDINNILIWSNENIVNVDFSQLSDVQANIEIYNILGQKLSEDKYVTSTVYRKEIPFIEEGYIVVSVKNNDQIITKKLFISNAK